MMRKHLKALKSKSLYTHSNEITINQLIGLLNGDVSALKRRFYARKSWLIAAGDGLIEDFSQAMDASNFDKNMVAYRQILQKRATLQIMENDLFVWKMCQIYGFGTFDLSLFRRFNLDPEAKDFNEKYKRHIEKEITWIKRYDSLFERNEKEAEKHIDWAMQITDMVISLNGGLIDKNTITAQDFYSLYIKHKRDEQRVSNQRSGKSQR
jgi:hypothetical protein